MNALIAQQWTSIWAPLRARRIAVMIAMAALVAAWIVLGPAGLLLGFVILASGYWYLRLWPCPRCHLPIVGAGLRTYVDRCAHCNLLMFGHPDDVRWTAPINPAGNQLPYQFRRFVGAYEALGGAMLMAMTAFAHPTWWRTAALEALAGTSVAAGVWLWRDEPRGYALSRILQLAQIIRIQSPVFVYVATTGAYLDLFHVNGKVGLEPGFVSMLTLGFGDGLPFGVSVNVWATLLLLVLLQARPTSTAPVLAENAAAVVDAVG